MIKADVEGSLAGFLDACVPLGGGFGELAGLPLPLVFEMPLPLRVASACALFFLRAMSPELCRRPLRPLQEIRESWGR